MNMGFLLQYILHPRTVGAVMPSSKRLSAKMMENIDFEDCKCIVEFGPGTGVFTKELLKRRRNGTSIILIEYNEEFYSLLKKKYGEAEGVHIINDSAENVKEHLKKQNLGKADYIVSGLPFASLPKDMSHKILEEAKGALEKNGKFITFQYTLMKKAMINQYFNDITVKKEVLNIPSAYVFNCSNS